ncbi:DUF29 domain-containing protein [Ancylobacter sp. G4_0304]|uniref:DUF29 domain-containing protein n=1 Tax=Ancylobacter sp. G4_0304 TaxID=3114289 RepID=UPI0039C70680
MNRHHRPSSAAPGAAGPAYERDFHGWAMEQAKRIREGVFEALDRENLAEEIESLGNEQFSKLESAYRVLLMHMLKWDIQPEKRTRSWSLTIAEQRNRARRLLLKNPSLKSRQEEAFADAYEDARIAAARETELDLALFPDTNPYSLDDIMDRPFEL